jgi:hypothetical protein
VLAKVRCSRARELSLAGRVQDARSLVQAELSRLRQRRPPTELLTHCVSLASSIERSAGNSAAALALIEEARRVEEAAGLANTDVHAETMFLVARAYMQAGRYREAEAAVGASARIHAALGLEDSSGMSNTQLMSGRIQREGGRPDRALQVFDAELADHARRGGEAAAMQVLQWDRGVTLLMLGRTDDAVAVLRASRDAALRRQDSGTSRLATASLVDALVETRQMAAAARELQTGARLFSTARREGAYTARAYLFARLRYALAVGDVRMARESLDEARLILAKLDNPADAAWREFNECASRLASFESRHAQALEFASEALRMAQAQALDPHESIFVADDLALRAGASSGLGAIDEARQDARRSLAIYSRLGVTARRDFRAASILARN